MKKSKLLLSTVLAGLGAGAVKVLNDHKSQIADDLHHQQYNLKHTLHEYGIYNELTPNQKKTVIKNFIRIIPSSDLHKSLRYQIDVVRYMKILKYLSTRDEFHKSDSSAILNIPITYINRVKPTLVKQNLLQDKVRYYEGKDFSTSYVLHDKVSMTINYLSKHYQVNQLVNPITFSQFLKNSIAFNIFR